MGAHAVRAAHRALRHLTGHQHDPGTRHPNNLGAALAKLQGSQLARTAHLELGGNAQKALTTDATQPS